MRNGSSLNNQVEIGGFVNHFGKWIEHGCPSIASEYPQLGHAGSSRVTTSWEMCIEFTVEETASKVPVSTVCRKGLYRFTMASVRSGCHWPNWRRDLNYAFSDTERSSVDLLERPLYRALRVEHTRRAVTPVPAMRKPFDVLAEGLLSEKNRDEKI
jgi:hypothetical protein